MNYCGIVVQLLSCVSLQPHELQLDSCPSTISHSLLIDSHPLSWWYCSTYPHPWSRPLFFFEASWSSSQHQVSSPMSQLFNQLAKDIQLHCQYFQWILFRVDFLCGLLVEFLAVQGLSISSSTTIQKHRPLGAQPLVAQPPMWYSSLPRSLFLLFASSARRFQVV